MDFLIENGVLRKYLGHGHYVTLQISEAYTRFVLCKITAILEKAVDERLLPAVVYFTENKLLQEQDFSAVMERAQRADAMEIVALLLDYRSKCLRKTDLSAVFALNGLEET